MTQEQAPALKAVSIVVGSKRAATTVDLPELARLINGGAAIYSITDPAVAGLVEAVQQWADAKTEFDRFERENPNNSTKDWDRRLYAYHDAQDGLFAALKTWIAQ